MNFITYLQQSMIEQLPKIIEAYQGDVSANNLSEMEKCVKELGIDLGNEIVRQWLEEQEQKYPDDEKICPYCGGQSKYVRRREGMTMTLQGRVYFGRNYYSCLACHQGFYPLDKKLGIKAGQMSDEVVQLAALFGIDDAFGTGHDLLKRSASLELSPNSIRKATQLVAKKVMAHEEELKEQSQVLEIQKQRQQSSHRPQRLYGSMDGFKVLFKDGWHDMKVGVWWTTKTDKQGAMKADNLRYYTDFLPASDFSDLVWATGFEHEADKAKDLVFVADGAEWIWRIVDQHYPQAVQIVDWYHACAYITPIAKVAFSDPEQQVQWIEQVKSDLWHGRLGTVIAACQQQVNSQRPDDPARKAVTYYQNNRHRMDYARFRELGYQIGSGSMESGCKQLGLARLKIAGARWSSDGATLVAKARAAYLSDQWDELNSVSDNLPLVA
jgi:Uncharacterised protein family (UPF0236)